MLVARFITVADIVGTWAGLRPLVADPEASGRTADLSRRHKVSGSHSGVVTITGGKLTTYRKLAEHALQDLQKFFPRMGGPWTAHKPLIDGELPDAPTFEEAFERFVARQRLSVEKGIDEQPATVD